MALDVVGILCCCLHREKSLRGSHTLEPLHLPLPSSGRLMRILRSIVAPSTALMAFCDSKLTGCSPIRAQVIRDELVWGHCHVRSFHLSIARGAQSPDVEISMP